VRLHNTTADGAAADCDHYICLWIAV